MRNLKVYELIQKLSDFHPDAFVNVRVGVNDGELVAVHPEHGECLIECSGGTDDQIIEEHERYEKHLNTISWEIGELKEAVECGDTTKALELVERIETELNSSGF